MKPTMAEIITAVAAEFEINPREITGTSRMYLFTHPRHMVCAIAHEAGYSLPVIAHRVGGRDHSSILYGVRQAVKIAAKNAAYRESLHKLRKSLLEGAADAAHINGMARRDAKAAKATIAALRNHIAPEAPNSAKSHGFAAHVRQKDAKAATAQNKGAET